MRKRQEVSASYNYYFLRDKHLKIERANLHPPPLGSDSDRVNTKPYKMEFVCTNFNQICQLL